MFCENLQFNLSLYSDDILNTEERAVIDEHLAQCPLCRQKLAEFQHLRNSLRVLPRMEVPVNRLNQIRKSVSAELVTEEETTPVFIFSDKVHNWVQMRLLPYSIGTVASLVFGFTMLWSMFSGFPNRQLDVNIAENNSSAILVANANLNKNRGDLAADEFPELNLPLSNAAPSVNPSGALIALTKSFARGSMKDDEVVVVADVFGNGLAQIAAVVEPTNDWKTVNDLEKALNEDPDFAPFISAKADQRSSDTVRVIFKIQRVDVSTKKKGKF